MISNQIPGYRVFPIWRCPGTNDRYPLCLLQAKSRRILPTRHAWTPGSIVLDFGNREYQRGRWDRSSRVSQKILSIVFVHYKDIYLFSSTNKLLLQVLDANYVEHDAYLLFEKLMHFAKPWYEFNENSSSRATLARNSTSVSVTVTNETRIIMYWLICKGTVDAECQIAIIKGT